jgi:DNA polymerase I
MALTVGFLGDGRVLEWEATADGAVVTERAGSTPRFYVGSRSPGGEVDFGRHPPRTR